MSSDQYEDQRGGREGRGQQSKPKKKWVKKQPQNQQNQQQNQQRSQQNQHQQKRNQPRNKPHHREEEEEDFVEDEGGQQSRQDSPQIEINPSEAFDDEVPNFKTDEVWVQGKLAPIEEDTEHEFKAVQKTAHLIDRIADLSKHYANSFLNTNGGVIYFGIEDDGSIAGLELDRKERDQIRLRIDAIVSHYVPQVDPYMVKVRFIKVFEPNPSQRQQQQNQNQQSNNNKSQQQKPPQLNNNRRSSKDHIADGLWVVELDVFPGRAPVYFVNDNLNEAYFRRAGSNYEMDPSMIAERKKYGRPKRELHSKDDSESNDNSNNNSHNKKKALLPKFRLGGSGTKDYVERKEEVAKVEEFIKANTRSEASEQETDEEGGRGGELRGIIAIYGLKGAGKSQFARETIARYKLQFSHNGGSSETGKTASFFVNMKSVTDKYITTNEAMVSIIRSIYPTITLPKQEQELQGTYLSCFGNKTTVLMLFENVLDIAQVLPLLPPRGFGDIQNLLVLLTSRHDLTADSIDSGFDILTLKIGPLTLLESRALFYKILKSAATVDNQNSLSEEVDKLIGLCGNWPMLIRIIGSTLRRKPYLKLDQLISKIPNQANSNSNSNSNPNEQNLTGNNRVEILKQFFAEGDMELWEKEIFDYDEPKLRSLYMISLFPGTFSSSFVSLLLNLDYAQTEDLLSEFLSDAVIDYMEIQGLVNMETNKYCMNDLIRDLCGRRFENKREKEMVECKKRR
eukprot:TRINITY_DN1318_c0_g1_i1.p1 TRINITY_DN1318_c0_g1~~TRINITY_DN1318_c0_g1_i1.p1  ORF type:complete len:771 (+),score=199.71 TRINITY_DN1318_c0_g1_i1:106-2313(+)